MMMARLANLPRNGSGRFSRTSPASCSKRSRSTKSFYMPGGVGWVLLDTSGLLTAVWSPGSPDGYVKMAANAAGPYFFNWMVFCSGIPRMELGDSVSPKISYMPTLSLNRPDLTEMIGRMARKLEQKPELLADESSTPQNSPDFRTLASIIDHTLLRPQATCDDLEQFCHEAVSLGVGAIAIHQVWVPLAVRILRGTGIKVGSVVGFPFGANHASVKRAEADASIRAGAEELDMVLNIGALRSGNVEGVRSDIQGVVDIAHDSGCILKVILENAYLSDEQKTTACQVAQQAGADYVKTSTGLGPSGATEADVRLMRKTVGTSMGVKAAGGIRSLEDAVRMLEAGADRLGTSASVAILAEAARRLD